MGKDTKDRKEGRKRKGGSESFSGSEHSPIYKDLKQNSYPFVLFTYIYICILICTLMSPSTHMCSQTQPLSLLFLVGKFPFSLCIVNMIMMKNHF